MSSAVLLATSSRDKVREIREMVGSRFAVSSPLDYPIAAPVVEEDGSTYYENVLKKAVGYYRVYERPVLADDSGLEVDALGGAPGIYSARFGGETISWPERWKHLHQKLAAFPENHWTARFRCVLCYYDGRDVPHFFEGVTEGRILPAPRGAQGFGYDPIFFSTILNQGFGEASPAEKERVSHRGRAVAQFLKWFP